MEAGKVFLDRTERLSERWPDFGGKYYLFSIVLTAFMGDNVMLCARLSIQ